MVLFAVIFTTVNGYLQGRYHTHFLTYDLWWFVDPRFLAGQMLFLFGMAANIHSDTILRGLRKPGETGYKIPCGKAEILIKNKAKLCKGHFAFVSLL